LKKRKKKLKAKSSGTLQIKTHKTIVYFNANNQPLDFIHGRDQC